MNELQPPLSPTETGTCDGESVNDFVRKPRGLSTAISNDDGIYNIHSRSRIPSRARTVIKDDEDPGLRREGDFREAQVCNEDACKSRD